MRFTDFFSLAVLSMLLPSAVLRQHCCRLWYGSY